MGYIFDPNQYDQETINNAIAGNRPELDPGAYRMFINGVDERNFEDSSSGQNVDAIIVEMEVLDGAKQGQKTSEFLTPEHPNEKRAAASIAQVIRLSNSIFGQQKRFDVDELDGKICYVHRKESKSKGKIYYNNVFITEEKYKELCEKGVNAVKPQTKPNNGMPPAPGQGMPPAPQSQPVQAPQQAYQQPAPQHYQQQPAQTQPAYNGHPPAQQAAPQQGYQQQAPQQAYQQPARQPAPQQGYPQAQPQAPMQAAPQQEQDVPF